MLVKGFMVPASKVSAVPEDASLHDAMETMLHKQIGCIVVLQNETTPIGIMTSRDLVQAYFQGKNANATSVKECMKTSMFAVHENESRDQAARTMEQNKIHHAIVINDDKAFVGLISSLDIVVEAVKDDRAHPWIRREDGKFHKPGESPQSPRSAHEQRRQSQTYLDFVDSVRGLPFMDD